VYKIGVLAIQGAISENIDMLQQLGVDALPVKRPGSIASLDGLVIPGGESTTIGRLIRRFGLENEIKQFHLEQKPIFGICAGMVILSGKVVGQDPILGLMNTTCVRNAFGRQRESFETDLNVPCLGKKPFRAVFIRAPLLSEVGAGVEVLASIPQGVVAARQGHLLATSFHPELTTDDRMHRYFLSLLK